MTDTDSSSKPSAVPHQAPITQQARQRLRTMNRPELETHQLLRLNRLLNSLTRHPLYAESLAAIKQPFQSLDELDQLPILSKSDLSDPSTQKSRLFTQDSSCYVRYHQTSGSRGWPLPILDTRSDWDWWILCWQYVLDSAQVDENDIAMMAFSFGPFIGFWSANDALVNRGALVVPGGGLSTIARINLIQQRKCTVVCCTPTYALHLASVARQHDIDLRETSVSRIIVAGEPGGSVPSVRGAIESQWDARVIDHAGASELGAWGFASENDQGLHVTESEFIAEFLIFDQSGNHRRVTSESRNESEQVELVMTNLGRDGGPVVRYRTGDIVQPVWDHSLSCRFVYLPGGVIGRADDMLVIRGVNVFPSSVEAIVRDVEPTAEFRMVASRHDSMDQLRIELESKADASNVRLLEEKLRQRLALRIPVKCVPKDSLPRSEAKSKRWIDERNAT